jgi:hypothetical protein
MTIGLRELYSTIVHPPASYELLFETANPALDTSPFPKTSASSNNGVTRNTTNFRNGTSSGQFTDGNNFININSLAGDDFSFTDRDFTIEVWLRPAAWSQDWNVVISKHQFISGYSWMFLMNASQLVWVINGNYFTIVNSSIPLNEWSHIAIVKYSGVINIYRNGSFAGSLANNTPYNNNTTTVQIGGTPDANTPNWRWRGQMDDLRVYRGYAKYTNNFTPI